jgi:peptidoglycan LD-endopeptidase CwlK
MTGLLLSLLFLSCNASDSIALEQRAHQLKASYPEHIKEVNTDAIYWTDGTLMKLNETDTHQTSLADQLLQPGYVQGIAHNAPSHDPGRIRCELFFKKMYGSCPQDVEKHLVTIDWMPRIFGFGTYRLPVTQINNIDKKLQAISDELEELVINHPEYIVFLKNPGGTYNWRFIANTTKLSNHSFGMTIDINSTVTEYWQWELAKQHLPISEATPLQYKNSLPGEIVLIFEKYGFIWGGKWYHYDTMHFEYRPELFLK